MRVCGCAGVQVCTLPRRAWCLRTTFALAHSAIRLRRGVSGPTDPPQTNSSRGRGYGRSIDATPSVFLPTAP